ncbi:MAG: alpha/beta hydrolase [Herminiimonas sp.]|nr:alpha/beta hydrolase [Herminiimonas sp.]
MSTPLKITLMLVAGVLLLSAIAACSPLQTINALTPESTYSRTDDLAFGSDPRDRLDIYAPARGTVQGLAPVVVFFYGGSWSSGSRKDYKFVGEALASRGILAVIADYRLYPQVRYPDFLVDSGAAVAWTAKEIRRYGGDPKRLFVMGHSAGAYNAAMVALDDRWLGKAGTSPAMLRGWIGLAGPYDFIPIKDEIVRPVFFYPNTPAESQPINHVTTGAPPALLIASRSDSLVDPTRNTGGLSAKLQDAGIKVETVYTEHTSHTSLVGSLARPLRGLAPTLDLVEQFVKSDGGRIMVGGTMPLPEKAAIAAQ